MTGQQESNICPTCGGRLESGFAAIPFIFQDTVIVVKEVPADICTNCRESFTTGEVTDTLVALISQLRQLQSEVSIVTYPESMLV